MLEISVPLLHALREKLYSLNMRIDVETVLQTLVHYAEDVPMHILDAEGRLIHASRAGAGLYHATIHISEHESSSEFSLTESGLNTALPEALKARRHFPEVLLQWPDGLLDQYALDIYPLPKNEPFQAFILTWRRHSVSQISGERGMPLRKPEDIPGAAKRFGLWTRSAEMQALFKVLEQVANSQSTVLVRGESGTGKEHIARALHDLSDRRGANFVAINCAALTPSLLESELFGHVKGAFTGALKARRGLFEQADKGTIFLDEIAELPLELQSKLLRVIQERVVTPVGSLEQRKIDVRIVSATHRSLRRAVANGRFREDLMYRLRVVPIFLPPLRERHGDLELLLSAFLTDQKEAGRNPFQFIQASAMRALLDYPWPGNVRELRNVIEYATAVGSGPLLTLKDLPPEFRHQEPPKPLQRDKLGNVATLPHMESDFASGRVSDVASVLRDVARQRDQSDLERIQKALLEAGGHRGKAAEILGMHRTTLWRKIRQYGLE